jgi:hypothetical protein
MNHSITLAKAIEMTTLYRQEKENILAAEYKGKDILSLCETFDAVPFVNMLNNPLCKSMRVYFGMSADLKVHTIFVGVNANNEDMLPLISVSSATETPTGDTDPILEDGISCPPICPPPSPLNQ